MHDPFFPPVPALTAAVEPWAARLHLPTLPMHVHEVLLSALLYSFVHLVVSPVLSTWLVPQHYPRNSRSRRVSWDSHVVSLVQSSLINVVALWIMYIDDERRQMDWEQRIWGYTGAAGLVQALVVGYFVWDFVTTLLFLDVFGPGLLAHAVGALVVYSFGFRPFLNFYGCNFILWELSTPFLNVHWFLDKLGMTGSRMQLYNGALLLSTFFSCRLIYGTYYSLSVYVDMWGLIKTPAPAIATLDENATIQDITRADTMKFATAAGPVPIWLALIYVASNVTLNCLNWFWFFKMIAAVRKRFQPSPHDQKLKQQTTESRKTAKTSEMTTILGSAAISSATEKIDELRRRRLEDLAPDSKEMDLDHVG